MTTVDVARVVLLSRAGAGNWPEKTQSVLTWSSAFAVRSCRAPRVINRALDAGRFERATGYHAPSWDEMLAEYRRDR